MLSARLPFRIAAAARPALLAQSVARTPVSRNVVFRSASKAYATPAKPKKGSIGATSTARKPRATKAKPTTATTTEPKTPRAPKAKKPKKPAAAKKPAARKTKKPRKVATPEELAAAKEKAQVKRDRARAKAVKTKANERLALLKAQALSPPSHQGPGSYILFYKARKTNDAAHAKEVTSQEFVKETGSEWNALSESEKESYRRRALALNAEAEAAYSAWVAEHSPNEIREANLARATLRRQGHAKYRHIRDSRQINRPAASFLRYVGEVQREFASAKEGARVAGERWRAMGEGEKQKYREEFEGAVAQYDRDFEALYGVPRAKSPAKAA